jgi:hypothetical protein
MQVRSAVRASRAPSTRPRRVSAPRKGEAGETLAHADSARREIVRRSYPCGTAGDYGSLVATSVRRGTPQSGNSRVTDHRDEKSPR